MKCDELKPITITDECGSYRVYNKSDVDAAIDELKAEHHKERHEYIKMIAELKAENEKLKAQFVPLYEELKRVKDENENLKKVEMEAK